MRTALATLMIVSLAACTWVSPDERGRNVRVAYSGDLSSSCDRVGEVHVSVKHAVAGFDRNEMKVRDELESLARNEAAVLGADTVQPLGEPADGAQRFSAWRCRR